MNGAQVTKPLSPEIVGTSYEPLYVDWTNRDAMLYAIAVGAGQQDPRNELQWTTENSAGTNLEVIPTFAATLAQRAGMQSSLPGVDRTKQLHAAQSLQLFSALATEGRVELRSCISGLEFKRTGALVHRTTDGFDALTRAHLFSSTSSAFIREAVGEGAYGDSVYQKQSLPSGAPTEVFQIPTVEWQALVFRLTGDRNPLHSDPAYAKRSGFNRPILHGLCSYGICARTILNQFASGRSAAFKSMQARFSRPVSPGQTLNLKTWLCDTGVAFQACLETGEIALDGGWLEFQFS